MLNNTSLGLCYLAPSSTDTSVLPQYSAQFLHCFTAELASFAMRRVLLLPLCAALLAALAAAAGPPVRLAWTNGVPYQPVALTRGQSLQLAWTAGPHTVYKVGQPIRQCPASA